MLLRFFVSSNVTKRFLASGLVWLLSLEFQRTVTVVKSGTHRNIHRPHRNDNFCNCRVKRVIVQVM